MDSRVRVKKFIMCEGKKRHLLLLGVLTLGMAFGFWGGAYWESNKAIAFNEVFWKAATVNQTIGGDMAPIRHRMVNDLIERYFSSGSMNRRQVIDLLGEPDDGPDARSNEVSYWLNEEYGLDIDPVKIEYLIIQFDSSGYVKKATHNVYRR